MLVEKKFDKHNEKSREFARQGCAYVHAETEKHECALVLGGDGIELLFIAVRLVDRLADGAGQSFNDTCDLLKVMHENYEEITSDVRN